MNFVTSKEQIHEVPPKWVNGDPHHPQSYSQTGQCILCINFWSATPASSWSFTTKLSRRTRSVSADVYINSTVLFIAWKKERKWCPVQIPKMHNFVALYITYVYVYILYNTVFIYIKPQKVDWSSKSPQNLCKFLLKRERDNYQGQLFVMLLFVWINIFWGIFFVWEGDLFLSEFAP